MGGGAGRCQTFFFPLCSADHQQKKVSSVLATNLLNVKNNKRFDIFPPVWDAQTVYDKCVYVFFPFIFFFLHLTYSRWTSSLPSCLWSQKIFPSLPGSRLTIFYRDASSALLQLVNQWLNFTYSRSHAFRYERKNTNPTLVRIELTTSVQADVQLTYY